MVARNERRLLRAVFGPVVPQEAELHHHQTSEGLFRLLLISTLGNSACNEDHIGVYSQPRARNIIPPGNGSSSSVAIHQLEEIN